MLEERFNQATCAHVTHDACCQLYTDYSFSSLRYQNYSVPFSACLSSTAPVPSHSNLGFWCIVLLGLGHRLVKPSTFVETHRLKHKESGSTLTETTKLLKDKQEFCIMK